MLTDFLTPMALGSLGPWEVIVILVVALLLFGHRLPDVARSAGKAVSEFKKGMREVTEETTKAVEADQKNEAPKVIEAKAEPKAPIVDEKKA